MLNKSIFYHEVYTMLIERLILLIFSLLLVAIPYITHGQGIIQEISTQELYTLHTKKDIVLFDVRTDKEYKQGHIPSAQWLDIENTHFEAFLATLDKEQTYIIYAGSEKRSRFVAQKMLDIGFTRIYHANEGIIGWKKLGHRITRGKCCP